MGIGRFVYTPILPVMEEGFGLAKDEAGLIASDNFLDYLLCALAAAKTQLPGSRRAWFLAALGASAATTAAMALGDSFSAFLLLRFLGGFASAFVLVFASALILERLALAGRPGLAALHFGGVGVGIALSALLVAALVGLGTDWRGLWLASGGLAGLACLFCLWAVPALPDAPVPKAGGQGGRVNGRLLALIAAYGLFGFGYVITATFLSVIAKDQPNLQDWAFALWCLVGLAAAPSIALWGIFARRFGNPAALATASVVEAAGVALSVLSSEPAVVMAAAVLLGGTFMGITALGLMQARLLSRGDPRRSLALMTASFGLGQMLGPLAAGFSFERYGGFLPASLLAAGLLLAASVLFLRSGAAANS